MLSAMALQYVFLTVVAFEVPLLSLGDLPVLYKVSELVSWKMAWRPIQNVHNFCLPPLFRKNIQHKFLKGSSGANTVVHHLTEQIGIGIVNVSLKEPPKYNSLGCKFWFFITHFRKN
ncbi:hypothetical protein Adt_44012 [Abeliophyllum distichum]|uniref:Uncharacterized protein n=1 Tax=Abeliophyllum distichum TaxID=126358 RepID=A0ABD1P9M3_9LAMI